MQKNVKNLNIKMQYFEYLMRSHELIFLFLKIKIKSHQVSFQNIYGLSWFCAQKVNDLKQI